MRGKGQAVATGPDQLNTLADRIERLTISRRDPEWFFAERSEIAAELRRVAAARVLPARATTGPGEARHFSRR